MTVRLAITVAGAVSLGSYEAGVLFEILDAIAQHNASASDGNKILIDVLTGASAGGMSVTVLAQKLLFDADSLADPYDNVLYRAWVRDIGLQGLLNLQQDEKPTHSILSSDLVETLSKKYLCQRYETQAPLAPRKHPASADWIRLGLALSNLNGIDYRYEMRPSQAFTYTRFQDRLYATIDSTSDRPSFWEPLRNAAVSSGAFPFAFRVKDLMRQRSEYDSPNIVFPGPSETFTYTDGGVFQNAPLGLAKNLVDQIDHHIDTESRFYLFIAPHAQKSTARDDFNAGSADFKATAVQLFNAIYGQAAFQDWIQADQVNSQINLFNQRALELKAALEQNQIPAAALRGAAGALLPLLFAGQTAEAETVAQGRQRLKLQFQGEYEGLARTTDSGVADIWIDSILALETAANLGQRDEMAIYGITATAEELAGSGLDAFVGFFAQEYRDHDYDVGRKKAQAFLQNATGMLGTEGNLPAFVNYVPKPVRPIDDRLNGLPLADVPRELRETVMSRLDDRANDVLKEMNLPWLLQNLAVRKGIRAFFIDPHIGKILGL
jgi:Patatin-like phospholipase